MPIKIIIIFEESPLVPAHKTIIGIHASGGIGLRIEKTGHTIRLKVGNIPKATPSVTPTTDAKMKAIIILKS